MKTTPKFFLSFRLLVDLFHLHALPNNAEVPLCLQLLLVKASPTRPSPLAPNDADEFSPSPVLFWLFRRGCRHSLPPEQQKPHKVPDSFFSCHPEKQRPVFPLQLGIFKVVSTVGTSR